jgi:hypothetical protein
MLIRISILFAALLLLTTDLNAKTVSLSGQASTWLLYEDRKTDKFMLGLRYIPELTLEKSFSDGKKIDALFAVKGYSTAPVNSLEDADVNEELKLYRTWLRFSTTQSEMRAGLQKINFGPAKILRSLKWFDHIDPEDPLKLTDGVNALLFRHNFLDNSGLWIWGIDGDLSLKGVEAYRTDDAKNEFGGRYQLTVPRGELGFSYNRRHIEKEHWNATNTDPLVDGEENRYAVDGNFDVVIGAWFEASADQIKIDIGKESWRNLLTLGADYTLSSGVYILYEHFIQSTGEKFDHTEETSEIAALSIGYDLGIIDSVRGIYYYDFKAERDSFYIDWQRTYDYWIINLSAYKNQDDTDGEFTGNGIRCMLTFNH